MLAAVFYHMTPEIPGVESTTATWEVEIDLQSPSVPPKIMDDTEGVEVSPR
jgi:hypothetical protein